MNQLLKLLVVAFLLILLPSCQTTDDPRAGGLFGYMATGDAGYQRRIIERQSHLDYVDNQNATEASRYSQLQGRKANVLAQKQKLSALRSEAMSLTGGVSLASQIHRIEQNAENISDLQSQVDKLSAEVAALRRRQ